MQTKQLALQIDQKSVSAIDGYRCVNCGKCEEYCPVDAVHEHQKEVCHVCPDCTEKKAMTVDQMYDLRSESCALACPLGISPQGYIQLAHSGKWKEAYDIMYDKNPLTTICGYICHHPCEEVCKRGTLVDEPLKMRSLKRFIGEMFIDEPPTAYPRIHDKHIAIIGAGPAGLTAAHWLSKKGYKVTVFEQSGEAGGMLLRGIPDFRLNKDIARKEIKRLEQAGIKFKFNAKIHTKDIDDLLKNYDKIVVSTGLQIAKKPPIEGWRTENVLFAVNLMEKVNSGQEVKLHGNCVVIGGGSVAMDTARTALRLGAENVTVVSLECGDDKPAYNWEIAEAKEEGIEFIEGVAPIRFLGGSYNLTGIECIQVQDLCTETFEYKGVPGTEKTLSADFAIIAVGQISDNDWEAQDNVILAGDLAGGECSVIDAMASGRAAALQIDNELAGRDYEEYVVNREVLPGEREYKIYPATRQKLQFKGVQKIDTECRKKSFELVEMPLVKDDAKLDAVRCMSCGYRKVDTELCLGCGVCQKVCPKGDVISMIAIQEEVGEVE
jgi:NADPH-dependent glutamate synthase beta subunit-like oxidoreductase